MKKDFIASVAGCLSKESIVDHNDKILVVVDCT